VSVGCLEIRIKRLPRAFSYHQGVNGSDKQPHVAARALVNVTSLRPIDFVLCVRPQLFAVSGFPVTQVGFPEHVRRLQRPAQFGFVGETDPHVHHPFLEHDLAVDSGILTDTHRRRHEEYRNGWAWGGWLGLRYWQRSLTYLDKKIIFEEPSSSAVETMNLGFGA
jgi:hypothetical protein